MTSKLQNKVDPEVTKKIKEEEDVRKAAIKKQFLEQTNDYFVIKKDEDYNEIKKNSFKKFNTWIIDGGGVYLSRRTDVGEFTARISSRSPVGLPKVMEPCYKLIVPRVPEKIYHQVKTFFRDIANEMHNAEAFVHIYYNKIANEYQIHVPLQIVSAGSVNYDTKKNLSTLEPEKYVFVMEIHSHNTMGAFFSSTDDGDEKATRFYGVFGKIYDIDPEFQLRFVVDGAKHLVSRFDVFSFQDKVEYPTEWKERVKKIGQETGVEALDKKEDYTTKWDRQSYNGERWDSNWRNWSSGSQNSGWSMWRGDGIPTHVEDKLKLWEDEQKGTTSVPTTLPRLPAPYNQGWEDDDSEGYYCYWNRMKTEEEKKDSPEEKKEQPVEEKEEDSETEGTPITNFPTEGGPPKKIEGYIEDQYSTEAIRDAADDLDELDSIEERWGAIGDFVNALYPHDVEMLIQHLEDTGYIDEIAKKLKRSA